MARAEIETGKASDINLFERAGRKVAVVVLSPVFRSERTDNDHGIDKAKEVLRQGNGLIIIINHFSLKDPPLAINEVLRHTEMSNKKVISPVAYHMDKKLYHWLGKMIGVTLKPIVTKNTVKEGKNNGRELNDGMKEYSSGAIRLLKEGGIVILAPQGTRMSHLGQRDNPTVGTLMATARRNGLENFAFLFIGFSIEGVDDYSGKKVRGFNPLRKYGINIGACLTSEEMLTRAGGDFRNVDAVIFEELRKVVPSNYR